MSWFVSLLKTEEPKVKESGTADNLWKGGGGPVLVYRGLLPR